MRIHAKTLLITGAMGLALATSTAVAQDHYGAYGSSYVPVYDSGPPEVVTVTSPRHNPSRSEIGAPIEYVSLSQPVPYDDLDLRTGWGVRELRRRINFTAISLCGRLDTMYPIDADNVTWPVDGRCYRNTMREANYQADHAIRAARYNAYYP